MQHIWSCREQAISILIIKRQALHRMLWKDSRESLFPPCKYRSGHSVGVFSTMIEKRTEATFSLIKCAYNLGWQRTELCHTRLWRSFTAVLRVKCIWAFLVAWRTWTMIPIVEIGRPSSPTPCPRRTKLTIDSARCGSLDMDHIFFKASWTAPHFK